MTETTPAPATGPSLNDLKVLAAQLPPSEQATSADAASLLSALTALATHGDGLIEASKQGGTAVADFYHQQAVDKAAAEGHPEPQRGSQIPAAALTASPPGAQAPIDYDKLAAAIVAAQKGDS